MAKAKPDPRQTLLLAVGVLFALLAVGVLVWLLTQSLDGRTVPRNSRFLVVLIAAFCAGFSAAAFSGSASLRGNLTLPVVGGGPLKMAVTGGSAVFVIVLILGYTFYVRDGELEPEMNLTGAVAVVSDGEAGRVLVRATYEPIQVPTGRRVYLVVASDEECRQPKGEGLVDNPLDGSMRLFLVAAREDVRCAQLVVKDRSGLRVAASRPVAIAWP